MTSEVCAESLFTVQKCVHISANGMYKQTAYFPTLPPFYEVWNFNSGNNFLQLI